MATEMATGASDAKPRSLTTLSLLFGRLYSNARGRPGDTSAWLWLRLHDDAAKGVDKQRLAEQWQHVLASLERRRQAEQRQCVAIRHSQAAQDAWQVAVAQARGAAERPEAACPEVWRRLRRAKRRLSDAKYRLRREQRRYRAAIKAHRQEEEWYAHMRRQVLGA